MVLGVSLLASLGVLSSGFAGWVIAAGSQEASGEGSISADYEVKTTGIKSVKLKENADTSICFCGSENGKTGWLSTDNKKADLEASFTFTIETYQKGEHLSFTKLAFSEVQEDKTESSYQTAFENKAVGTAPAFLDSQPSQKWVGYIELVNLTKTNGKDEATASIPADSSSIDVIFKIHFAWGELFQGENPLDFYNASSATSELMSNAATNIGLLKSADGAKFKLSFTVGTTK